MSLGQLLSPFDRPAVYDETPEMRARQLYNRELKKGVELGRKLGAFERRFGKLRAHITDVVNRAVLEAGLSPTDPVVLEFRNTVRIMKGKNTHEYK